MNLIFKGKYIILQVKYINNKSVYKLFKQWSINIISQYLGTGTMFCLQKAFNYGVFLQIKFTAI